MLERITEERLRQIYNETIDALYGYASRRCGGQRELAEDVTQEAWLRAVRQWREKGVPESPIAWLTAVARNLLLSFLRRQQPDRLDDIVHADVLAAVEENTGHESVEVASLVRGALARIPAPEARLLEAFHYEHHKVAQLAESY